MNARERAESYFLKPEERLPAAPALQPCTLPDQLQVEFDRIPEVRRKVAFKIALGPTLEARQRIWMAVPHRWHAEVSQAVALTMGAMIGTLPTGSRASALLEVPTDLRPAVSAQARRVADLS